jgi:heme-degrading monooxygenase HmoA
MRAWKATAAPEDAERYPTQFRERVVPELRRVSGFVGALLLRREVGGWVEFTVLTRWASMDAIRAFAGQDVSRAVVEPGAIAVLKTYEREVVHHEILAEVEILREGPEPAA